MVSESYRVIDKFVFSVFFLLFLEVDGRISVSETDNNDHFLICYP
jgi:hypothetical protein